MNKGMILGLLLLAAFIIVLIMTSPLTPPAAGKSTGAVQAVNTAVSYAAARSVTQFISVVDRRTGTVLAEDGMNFARQNRQANVVVGHDAGIALGDVLQFQARDGGAHADSGDTLWFGR